MEDRVLTKDVLLEYGFMCEKEPNYELQLDGIWYKNFNLCEDWYDGSFNFAVYVRSTGCMKSGYSIATEGRLKELYKGITGREIQKAEIPNKL